MLAYYFSRWYLRWS